ncbi:hypothetical protein FHS95_004038 [Sphingomonas naasensis]|uniref:DUF2332 domain-containing protein n=1 Tax=Sphingomonas naasensis TaxID=1344951 RepID=A0A4S1WCK3_9SPHN|nr:DUF2332 domain-containing protein [Sphingomonas naasensis]NIJ22323.1 hypothetical protein [Sphingomonas naasensis]TGX40674.1 DUF2332 domain-containing protein [Sphingomonas naasensis]
MADEQRNRDSFRIQAGYCTAMAAPITARIATVLGEHLTRDSATGRRVLDWPGEPVADALVLRLIGGLHALYRRGVPEIAPVFSGAVTDEAAVAAILNRVFVAHDAALLPWLDGPPQTNEAGRSAGLMTGILHLAARYGPRFELLEIGSSAGLNLLISRYRFDLGGARFGPTDSPVTIRPEWRGPPPPDAPVEIVRTSGVDIQPLDLSGERDAERLQAYCWVENVERQARLEKTIAMVRAEGVDLVQGDAADWVEARLAEPQPGGVTRVLMHSVVWQYLPEPTQRRIAGAMAAAGARATPERPLGWVMMEPNRDLHRHEVRVRGWPGDTPMELVALTHAHGAWVEALEPPYETRPYVMRAW